MYLFSADRTMAVDTNHGTLLFGLRGMTQGEELDTFIIVPQNRVIEFVQGKQVEEANSIFYSERWKPKTIQLTDNTITLNDPEHLITTAKGRKKNVLGTLTGTIDRALLMEFVREIAKCAYFDLSMRSTKDSKERKAYERDRLAWVAFTDTHYDTASLMDAANHFYYTSMPMGVLPKK